MSSLTWRGTISPRTFFMASCRCRLRGIPQPALTRARLAESRERICDAMAAEAVSGRGRYARSLLRLASMLSTAARLPAPCMPWASSIPTTLRGEL